MEHALQLTCSGQSRQIGHSSSSSTIECELDFLMQNKASSSFKAWMSRFTRTPLNQKSCPDLSAAQHSSVTIIAAQQSCLTVKSKHAAAKCDCTDCFCHIGMSSLDAWETHQHLQTMLTTTRVSEKRRDYAF